MLRCGGTVKHGDGIAWLRKAKQWRGEGKAKYCVARRWRSLAWIRNAKDWRGKVKPSNAMEKPCKEDLGNGMA